MEREAQIKQAARDIALNWNVGRGNEFYYRLDKLTEMAQWCDNNPQSPWISIKEEKPAQGKDVIFMLPDGLVYRGFRKIIDIRDRVFLRGAPKGTNCYMISDVAYWMPIPELKKGE